MTGSVAEGALPKSSCHHCQYDGQWPTHCLAHEHGTFSILRLGIPIEYLPPTLGLGTAGPETQIIFLANCRLTSSRDLDCLSITSPACTCHSTTLCMPSSNFIIRLDVLLLTSLLKRKQIHIFVKVLCHCSDYNNLTIKSHNYYFSMCPHH